MSILVRFLICCFLIFVPIANATTQVKSSNKIALLKESLHLVMENKDAKAMPRYFDPDFEEISNSFHIKYPEFQRFIEKMHNSPILFQFQYQDNTFVESGDMLAGRFFMTVQSPNKKPVILEIIFITRYKNNKLYRYWELTRPDWSELPEFKN